MFVFFLRTEKSQQNGYNKQKNELVARVSIATESEKTASIYTLIKFRKRIPIL